MERFQMMLYFPDARDELEPASEGEWVRYADAKKEIDRLCGLVNHELADAGKWQRQATAQVQEIIGLRKELTQIAASLAEFERVEAVGMRSATMPDKIDALLRDLARLRRKDREAPAAVAADRARIAAAVRKLHDECYDDDGGDCARAALDDVLRVVEGK